MIRLIAVIVAIIIGLPVLALMILPLFVSTDAVKAEVARQVQLATGWQMQIREIGVGGSFAGLKLEARGMDLATAQGQPMAGIETARITVSPFSILSGNVRVTGITVLSPNILFESRPDGSLNWSIDGATVNPDAVMAEGATTDAPDLSRLTIDTVSVSDGRVTMRDPATGAERIIENLNLTATGSTGLRELSLDGSADYAGRGIGLTGQLDALPDFLEGRMTAARLNLTTDFLGARFEGQLSGGQAASLNGNVAIGSSKLADMLVWLSGAPATYMPVDAIDITASVGASRDGVSLTQFRGEVGGEPISGDLVVNLAGAKPALDAEIAVEQLTIPLPEPAALASGESDAGGTSAMDAAIDLDWLNRGNARIVLRAGTVNIGEHVLSPVSLGASLVDGRIDVALGEMAIAGGRASGSVSLDGRSGLPVAQATVLANDLDLAALRAIAGSPHDVSGRIDAQIGLAGQGQTARQMRESFNAAGSVALRDGAMSGLPLTEAFNNPAASRVTGVTLQTQFNSLVDPVDATGGFTFLGESFNLAAQIAPRGLLAGGESPAAVSLASNRVSARLSGRINPAGAELDGRFAVQTPSLRGLMAWMGRPLEAGVGLEDFSFDGNLALSPQAVSFSDAAISLDGSSGTGNGRIALGNRPSITAKLALDRLLLDPYMGDRSGSGSRTKGWSRETIDVSGLRSFDADLDLSAREIVWGKIRTGQTNLGVRVAEGRLRADLTQMALYEGQGSGFVALDGSGSVPGLQSEFRLQGMSAYPMLRDVAGFTSLEGRAALNMTIASSGQSQYALMQNLSGNGGFAIRDGAIRGINIPQMMRGLTLDVLLGWQPNEAAKTDFAEFTGTYQIERGILTNRDLQLVGPLVRMTGAGTVNLPERTLNYRVNPQLVTTLQGQGTQRDLQGFAVPVVISGSWDNPRIYPEIDGILENPQVALQQLRQMGGGIFDTLLDGGGNLEQGLQQGIEGLLGQQLGLPNVGQGAGNVGQGINGLIQDGRVNTDQAIEQGTQILNNFLGGGQQPAPQPAPQAAPQPQGQPQAQPQPQPQQPATVEDQVQQGVNNLLNGLFGN
jgi:AsmA protein